jgi:hypothetical protein
MFNVTALTRHCANSLGYSKSPFLFSHLERSYGLAVATSCIFLNILLRNLCNNISTLPLNISMHSTIFVFIFCPDSFGAYEKSYGRDIGKLSSLAWLQNSQSETTILILQHVCRRVTCEQTLDETVI